MNRYPRRRTSAGGAAGLGCIAIILINLLLLGAAVWVVASVIKAVFS